MIKRNINEFTLLDLAAKDDKYHEYLENGPSQCGYFLEKLYGPNPPGWLLIWTNQGGFKYPICTMDNDEIVNNIIKEAKTSDIRFSVGLRLEEPENNTLMDENQIVALPGFWMIIPFKGPTHPEKYIPASISDAIKFLNSQNMKPDIIIDTGYELQAHWNFKTLCTFDNGASSFFDHDHGINNLFYEIKRMSKDFQKQIIDAGKKCRWMLSDTSSFLTKLRVPGTFNWILYPPKPVTILEPKKNVWKIY